MRNDKQSFYWPGIVNLNDAVVASHTSAFCSSAGSGEF